MNKQVEKIVPKCSIFTNYIFKTIPLAFDESMSYYETLCALKYYLKNVVIPTLNNNADAVIELQNLYNELYEYVMHYFDNLDVQEEINNKLDEMVEDGTFTTLITNIVNPVLTDLTEQINATETRVNNIANSIFTPIEDLRKKYYDDYSTFELPTTFNSYFDILQLYRSNDKQNFKHNIRKEMLPFTTSETVYVDNVNGSNSNDGSTKALAFKTIDYAISSASSNRTVILLNDIYYRGDMPNSARAISYDFNFISENGHSIMGLFDKLTYSTDETYTNVYKASRSNANMCIDIRGHKNGAYAQLERVDSLLLCSNTLNSWYTDGTDVYVNIGEVVTNDKVLFGLGVGGSPWNITNSSKALHLYFENIDFIANNYAIMKLQCSTYVHEVRMYGCKLLFCTNTDYDGFSNQGCKSLLVKTTADRNYKDGFNYHAYNSKKAYGIEIDCIGSNNGYGNNANNNNGSTAHDGCQVIRVNGNYFNNKGGNVADVSQDTLTACINCNAFDTVATQTGGYNTDFVTQQAGATMYLYNCFSAGSNSDTNLYAVTDSTIYYDNCKFDTTSGNVIEIN